MDPNGVVAAAATTQDLDDNNELMMQVQNYVWKCSFSYITSMSLKCAVELSIPDVIHKHGKPMTLSSLVEALALPKTKTRFLNHLMSFLVHSNFFRLQKLNQEEEQEGFCLTPFSRSLVKENNPNNFSSVVLSMVDPAMVTQFQYLSDWFRGTTSNGGQQKTAFETAHGMNFWSYTEKNPKLGKTFDDAMASYSTSQMNEIIEMGTELFKNSKSLVDVGGGIGISVQAISQAFPHLKCSVFDLPNVVANHLPETNHLEFIGGDMFESIPHADAILLKSVLHNWSDEDCVKILKKCKEAIPSREEGGKLIILDIVMEKDKKQEDEVTEIQLLVDLLMMSMFASNERTEEQWNELFVQSGFTNYKITPLPGHESLIEVYP